MQIANYIIIYFLLNRMALKTLNQIIAEKQEKQKHAKHHLSDMKGLFIQSVNTKLIN